MVTGLDMIVEMVAVVVASLVVCTEVVTDSEVEITVVKKLEALEETVVEVLVLEELAEADEEDEDADDEDAADDDEAAADDEDAAEEVWLPTAAVEA